MKYIQKALSIILVGFFVFSAHHMAPAQQSGGNLTPGPIDDSQDSIYNHILPDFKIVTFWANRKSYSYWKLFIGVKNVGGNKGLKGLYELPIAIDILECKDRDMGESDFICHDPQTRLWRHTVMMTAPLAGQGYGRILGFYSRWPHDIYVKANAYKGGTQGPYREKDSPELGNNQALLRIIWDPNRLWRDWWVWPKDSIPY